MIEVARKLSVLYNQREKAYLCAILALNILGSFLEVLGIGALIPIITLLTKPEIIEKNSLLLWMKKLINPASNADFIVVLSLIFLSIMLLKNLFLFSVTWIQSRFLNKKYLCIADELYSSFLNSPYSFHLRKNTASLQQHMECIGAVINGLMFPSLTIFTEVAVTVTIIIALAWIDIASTAFIAISFIVMVGIFYVLTRIKLKKWGETRNYHRTKTIQQINQGLGGIKETKILHKEKYFIGEYVKHLSQTLNVDHKERVVLQTPRLYIETITVVLIVGIMLYFLNYGNDPQIFLIKMSLFAVAAIRIMPSFGRISASMSTMRIYTPALDVLLEDLRTAGKLSAFGTKEIEEGSEIRFKDNIELKSICFNYEDNLDFKISDVNLKIKIKNSVAFVGPTGAGKTTVVDIITGLLSPVSGKVEVDGLDIASGMISWQRQIGYIPQNIYLTDDTIRRNIAFGVCDAEIDEKKIQNAIRLAQLENFISGLQKGIDTEIGERGVRISGGERQRIGIARALYNDPEVIVMDEATSSLDNETERAFMEAIKNLGGKKTIIIIAHRLTTVQHCDKIFFLEKGKLIAEGRYDELLQKCKAFAGMAGISTRSEIS